MEGQEETGGSPVVKPQHALITAHSHFEQAGTDTIQQLRDANTYKIHMHSCQALDIFCKTLHTSSQLNKYKEEFLLYFAQLGH